MKKNEETPEPKDAKTTKPASKSSESRHRILGGIDIALALLLLFMIWIGLPARWWPVDVGGTALALLLGVAGGGLYAGTPWAHRAGVIAGAAALVIGTGLFTGLAFTASHVAGLYGPVGQGGALILFTVSLLVLPYLVALPAAQLFVLTRRATTRSE
jgi:hypothetical protein